MKIRSLLSVPSGVFNSAGFRDHTTLLIVLLALIAWGAAFSLWNDAGGLRTRRNLAERRFNDFLSVMREYKTLSGARGGGSREEREVLPADQDLLTAVSTVVSSLGLRSSMVSLSSASARGGEEGVSISLEGISTENLATFLQETERRGLSVFSAEIRAVRGTASSEKPPLRTLNASLLLGRL